jgi:hypothetical protein
MVSSHSPLVQSRANQALAGHSSSLDMHVLGDGHFVHRNASAGCVVGTLKPITQEKGRGRELLRLFAI